MRCDSYLDFEAAEQDWEASITTAAWVGANMQLT